MRRYAANALWMMATRAAWVVSALTVGIYVTRKLGPYNFGVLNYAIALTGIFSIVATMSVEEIVIRQLIRSPGNTNRILGNFFMFRLALFLLMFTSLGITLWLMRPTSELYWLCIILSLGYAGYVVQGGVLYFQARVESKYAAIPQLLSCLVNSCIRIAAAYFDWPLLVFAMAEASNLLIYHFGCMYYYWHTVSSPRCWNWAWREVRLLLADALPLAICGVFSLVYARTDQLMIGYFLDLPAVGYYSLATRFTENLAIAANLLCISFFPAVVTAAQVSLGAYQKQLHRLYFLVFWSMAGAAVVTAILCRPLVHMLFGTAYLPAVPVIKVFIWTLLGTAILYVFTQWAINERHLSMIAWSFASGALINVFLNPLFINYIGINGAALSSLISMPLGLVLTLIWQPIGQDHLKLILRSILTLPSFKLGEHTS